MMNKWWSRIGSKSGLTHRLSSWGEVVPVSSTGIQYGTGISMVSNLGNMNEVPLSYVGPVTFTPTQFNNNRKIFGRNRNYDTETESRIVGRHWDWDNSFGRKWFDHKHTGWTRNWTRTDIIEADKDAIEMKKFILNNDVEVKVSQEWIDKFIENGKRIELETRQDAVLFLLYVKEKCGLCLSDIAEMLNCDEHWVKSVLFGSKRIDEVKAEKLCELLISDYHPKLVERIYSLLTRNYH